MNPADLATWKRFAEEATPGPWEVTETLDRPPHVAVVMESTMSSVLVADIGENDSDEVTADAAFIAAARTAVPALVARVEELEGEVAALKRKQFAPSAARDIKCPSCPADPGEPCLALIFGTGSRYRKVPYHAARRRAAAAVPPAPTPEEK